ncbi:hypothetical protein D3C86_1645830 [compost metagenome]
MISSPLTTSAIDISSDHEGHWRPTSSSSTAAVTGPSAWKPTTRLASSRVSAQSQQKYPTPLDSPIKATCPHCVDDKDGHSGCPVVAQSASRNTTAAHIASTLVGKAG